MNPDAPSFIERAEGEDLGSFSARVAPAVVGRAMEPIGGHDIQVMNFDSAKMAEVLERHFADCEVVAEDTVSKVILYVNDYRKRLGVELLSVAVIPTNRSSEAMEGPLDDKFPTVGFVFPGQTVHEVHFLTGESREAITSLSDYLPLKDSSNDANRTSGPMSVGDYFEASESVGARLVVTDLDKLNAAEGVRHMPLPSEQNTIGGVYFCQYFPR